MSERNTLRAIALGTIYISLIVMCGHALAGQARSATRIVVADSVDVYVFVAAVCCHDLELIERPG